MSSKPTDDAQRLFFGVRIPFLDTLGLVADGVGPDRASARLAYRTELSNSAGAFHGGALMTVLDFAMSAAARGSDLQGVQVSTVDMRTSFLRPALGDVLVHADCIRRGRSIAFCEARARDATGELVAMASGTFMLKQGDAR